MLEYLVVSCFASESLALRNILQDLLIDYPVPRLWYHGMSLYEDKCNGFRVNEGRRSYQAVSTTRQKGTYVNGKRRGLSDKLL